MILGSTKETVRYQPDVEIALDEADAAAAKEAQAQGAPFTAPARPDPLPDDEAQPVYLLGIPSLAGKAKMRRAVMATGATYVADTQLRAELRKAVAELLPDGSPERVSSDAAIDMAEALADPDRKAEVDDEAKVKLGAVLVEVEKWARRHWPPYAELLADSQFWWETTLRMCVVHFLRGWERKPEAFEARAGECTEATLAAIPAAHFGRIGMKILSLMRPTESQQKN